MSKSYTNIHELLKEVTSFKIIDLVRHVVRLDQNLLAALHDPVPGLYVSGSIEPLFESSKKYTLSNKETHFQITGNDIVKSISNPTGRRSLPPGDIFGENGNRIIKRSAFENMRSMFSLVPNVPTRGCELAVAVIVDYLDSISPNTNCHASIYYDLQKLIKPEFSQLLENSTFEIAFDDLIREVQSFVGKDIGHIYTVSVVNTSVLIKKGLDFRIVDWEMQQLTSQEEFDHDLGGVPDGYAKSPVRARKRFW